MSEISDGETLVSRLFDEFNDNEICYVVSRKYEDLPDVPDEDDIDLFVRNGDFEPALECCRAVGFESRGKGASSRSGHLQRKAMEALRKPRVAIRKLSNSPKEIYHILTRDLKMTPLGHRNVDMWGSGIHLDIRNNLAYRSPMDGSRIPVDQSVTEYLYERRSKVDNFYVPSHPDELAHIVSHCVFDKEGTFGPYYVDRCDQLVEELHANTDECDQFRELLDAIYYEAGDLVYELVRDGRYEDILDELYGFNEY